MNTVYIVFYDGKDKKKPKGEFVYVCKTLEIAKAMIHQCIYPDNEYFILEEYVIGNEYNVLDR